MIARPPPAPTNPHKPPRIGWGSREVRGELKFTSTTRADRFRPRSSEVQFNTLVKVVSWSTYNHETDSFVVRY